MMWEEETAQVRVSDWREAEVSWLAYFVCGSVLRAFPDRCRLREGTEGAMCLITLSVFIRQRAVFN